MQAQYRIHGMHCNGCVEAIQRKLAALPKVQSVQVTLTPPAISLESEEPIDIQLISDAVRAAGNYDLDAHPIDATQPGRAVGAKLTDSFSPSSLSTYYPLILILVFLVGVCVLLQFRHPPFVASELMYDFMGGFFVVFAFFKLLNLSGFANTFRRYDLAAQYLAVYAWIYPFAELALGVAYLARWHLLVVNIATLILMSIGTVGVVRTMFSGRQVACACLGTAFQLPVSTATLVENVGMGVMAAIMLLW